MKNISEMSMEELAVYYHWNDEQSLDQAIWVVNENDFDMDSIEFWSGKEGMITKFKDFKAGLDNLR